MCIPARFRLFVLAALLPPAVGCGASRVPVAGTVTFEGKPVDSGGIQFVPLDPALPPEKVGGPVTDGAYSIDDTRGPFPGKYRVEIFWKKMTGKTVSDGDGGKTAVTVEGLPAKYNTQSELTADIGSSTRTLDFNLTP